jgi:hypothetical protein
LIKKALFEHAEDSIALFRCGDRAGVVPTEDTVTEAGDKGVAELAHGAGKAHEQGVKTSSTVPGLAKNLQGADDGIGAAIEALVESEGVGDENDALWRAGGRRHSNKFEGEGALERDKAEFSATIVAEDETYDPVAEGADAIVEDYRTTFDPGAVRFVHCGR